MSKKEERATISFISYLLGIACLFLHSPLVLAGVFAIFLGYHAEVTSKKEGGE